MKPILYFVLIALFSVSCGNQEFTKQSPEVNSSEEIAKELMALWEFGDTLKTNKIFLEECSYVDIPNNHTFSGIAGVNAYISHIHKWASNVKMTVRKINASESGGYVEWTMTAVHSNPIEGRIPIATNKEINLKGTTLIELKNGKIEKASDYMDVLGFVMQLGSKLELPGGVVIGE
jgi:steroid delta-isomerase-like uncharacterized protein